MSAPRTRTVELSRIRGPGNGSINSLRGWFKQWFFVYIQETISSIQKRYIEMQQAEVEGSILPYGRFSALCVWSFNLFSSIL